MVPLAMSLKFYNCVTECSNDVYSYFKWLHNDIVNHNQVYEYDSSHSIWRTLFKICYGYINLIL